MNKLKARSLTSAIPGHRIRARSLLAMIAMAIGLTLATSAAGAPGDLDPSFGTGGIVQVGGGPIAVQPDGKIVLVGGALDVTRNPIITVTRLNVDGTVDAAFGSSGTTAFKFAG